MLGSLTNEPFRIGYVMDKNRQRDVAEVVVYSKNYVQTNEVKDSRVRLVEKILTKEVTDLMYIRSVVA